MISTEIIRRIAYGSHEYVFDESFREYEEQAREYLKQNEDSTFDLVRAELLAFFILLGSDYASAYKAELNEISPGGRQSLALDRWLLEMIQKEFGA
jgi:hypothetical protein